MEQKKQAIKNSNKQLSAAALESTQSHMSTSVRLLSSGMTYFSRRYSEETSDHCIFHLIPEKMQHSSLTVLVHSGIYG